MATQVTQADNSIEFELDPQTEAIVTGYEVKDLRTDEAPAIGDWMTKLLMNKEFQLVPANNLQTIFSKLKQTHYKAGQHVIEQGNPGKYFYVITAGRCSVTRELAKDRGSITLAELTVGDTFGEEALITDAMRQATITMLTDGTMMKLDKDDFRSLLNEPIVSTVNTEEADEIIENGGNYIFVDNSAADISTDIVKTTHIPMHILRLKLDQLDLKQHQIVTSAKHSHACAAAHILSQYGFSASVLQADS